MSSSAFAAPAAGSGYFATAEHYRHLAKGVVDALRRGGLVLVTGDPPACLPMLTEALSKAATPRAVIEISCDPTFDCREPFRGEGAAPPDASTSDGAEGEEGGSAALPSAIYLFEEADRLSDVQIETLLEAAQAEPPGAAACGAGVLVAHSSFPARLEPRLFELLQHKLAAQLRLEQLDRDEVEAFIRYQLPPESGSNFLTAQRVALIAITSGGDPAVVNRLARRMLEAEPGAPAGRLLDRLPRVWRSRARKPIGEKLTAEPKMSIAGGEIAPRKARRRRPAAALMLSAGIIGCVGLLGLIVGALGSGDLHSLLRKYVLPRKDGSVASLAVPARVTPPVAPPATEPARVASPVAPPAAEPARVAPPAAEPARVASPAAEPARVAPPGGGGAVDPPRAALASEAATEPAAAAGPRLSADEIAALVARGDAFLWAGDVASARLFFERAADAGDGRAAMRMAVTFDAAFLDRAGVHGSRGDTEQAAFWYRRARDLGEVKIERGTAPSTEGPSKLR